MGRGQYDRSTMRRPTPVATTLDPFNQSGAGRTDELADTKRQLVEALAKVARLERLCRTHGLWIDG